MRSIYRRTLSKSFVLPNHFQKFLKNYQSKLWYQLLVSRSEMFMRLEKKTKRRVNWFSILKLIL